jgi:CRISPR-associated protein (TIGR02584 family)
MKNILLCVTGLTPQIVTETLYGLAVAREPAWLPDEIHVVTTTTGRQQVILNLLTEQANGEPGWFHRLRRDCRLPEIAFDANRIHVIADAQGRLLDDIRTPADNEIAADFITGVVCDLTRDDASALHVSIAGGRKTMGYYLGYALSLYGRAQDSLSHVLVSEPFENNRGFYYPTPYSLPIHVRHGDRELTFDARDGRVEMAEIPFVRMRDGLPGRLLDGRVPLSRTVAIANRAYAPPLLEFDAAGLGVRADGEALDLRGIAYVFLRWLAERARDEAPALALNTPEAASGFLACARRVLPGNNHGVELQRAEEALAWRADAPLKLPKYFEPHKSRIKKAFEDALGERAARRYELRTVKTADGPLLDLPLAPEHLKFEG